MSAQSLRIKTSHLTSLPEKEEVLIFSSVEEIAPGTFLFGLVKILGRPDHKRKQLIQIISEQLQSYKEGIEEQGTISRSFEQLLATVNEAIADHIAASAKIPLTDFHAVVGIVHEQQLFLSGYGSLLALFLHRTAKQRYVIYELNRQFQEEEITWDKLFTTVLDGELHPGDVFYLGTRISNREMTTGELQDVLVTLPPSGALKRIQQFLHRSTPYGAICIQVFQPSNSTAPKKLNPFSSIEQLGQTKAQTAELLGEQTPDIGGWVQKGSQFMLDQLSAPGSRGVKHAIFFVLRFLIKILTQIVSIVLIAIKEFFSLIWHGFRWLYHLYRSHRSGERNLIEETTQHAESTKKYLQRLPRTTKYLAAGILATMLIFIVTMTLLNTRKINTETEATFTLVQERIEESIAAAEASLIYENETQAWESVNEALALFETLMPANRKQEEDYQNLQAQLDTLLLSIRGITTPDLTSLASIIDTTPIVATEVNGIIYFIDASNHVYRYDELNSTWQALETTNGSIGTISSATGEGGNILFLDKTNNLGRIDLASATSNPIVSGSSSLESADNLFVYNDSLYILSSATQQLVKMRPQGDGYEAGTSWITSRDSDLSTAQDLAIDGDIFILTSNAIRRFNSGRELTFELDLVDPPLTDAKSIWTTIETNYLYVLEPAQERLLVFDKNGDLIAQYIDASFAQAIEMIVREDENRILLVTNESLLSFPAEHLLQ